MSEVTHEQVLEYCRKRCLVLMDREFFEHLKRWPADMVEVVRCADCKYCLKEDDYSLWCHGFCSPARLVRPDDFCSHGKRKEAV